MSKENIYQIASLPLTNNYGGYMQSLALYIYCKEKKLNTEILDTYPKFDNFKSNMAGFLSIFFSRRYKPASKNNKRIMRMRNYYKKFVQLTAKKRFDAILIWGSDQIWREDYNVKYSYVEKYKKFFIYGASSGNKIINMSWKYLLQLKKTIQKAQSVSCRELENTNYLLSSGIKTSHVCDPTLLLSKDHYLDFFNLHQDKNIFNGDLSYLLDAKEEDFKADFTIDFDNDNLEHFIQKFKDCDRVITDSYHGVLFSIIFNKPVKIIFNKERGEERFRNIIAYANNFGEDFITFNQKKIEALRDKSINFIDNSIKEMNKI